MERNHDPHPVNRLSRTRYGVRHVYQLIPLQEQPIEEEVKAMPHEIPSIDLRCSRCGTSQTYKVVPDSVAHSPA